MATLDANEAVASVAYRASELVIIYPITPSTSMAEHCDEWSVAHKRNIWGAVPEVSQMQSEGGVAGALHGSLQAGSLATTFTASQGLLLMQPNMYKMSGELTPFCMHVTARSLATHALSIFGDHSDVMSCRSTGFAMLASNSVQEAQDVALIAHAATLASRIPFIHFFDGFRTSHEINKISLLPDETVRAMIDEDLVEAHRLRALTPDHPVVRGTAQNPDVFFQAREAANRFYMECPRLVEEYMERFAELTGRRYSLFEYEGADDAEDVIIIMGSGAETVEETSRWLNAKGRKTGVLKVRLYRPFSLEAFCQALPETARNIAVLDRTKEPGSLGEPLYQDVCVAIYEGLEQGTLHFSAGDPRIIGGRYGLGSKEFTPAMVKAVYDELQRPHARNHFTVGIVDDVTDTSLPVGDELNIEPEGTFSAIFYGLGSDGTVGANKNSIKIIGEGTENYAQAYFVYDSKKSGAMTISHLRFGREPIRAPYLVANAQFVACHQPQFLERYDVLAAAAPGGVFLLNTPYSAEAVWDHLPRLAQEEILHKQLQFYVVDAYEVARRTGMGGRINTIMQTCFFAISGVLPSDEAISRIKQAIKKSYGRKGEAVLKKNWDAVDASVAGLTRVKYPLEVTSTARLDDWLPQEAPDFVKNVTAAMLEGRGDLLPVSAFPVDGTWAVGTSRWEKRSIAQQIPVWDADLCTQCNRCVLVCPHAAIRAKFYPSELAEFAPDGFKFVNFRSKEFPGNRFTIQVAPDDCTGCAVCVSICPAKDKKNPERKAINMEMAVPIRAQARESFKYFEELPLPDRTKLGNLPKDTQFRQPLFEFSGACSGCGQTPYIKLLTQMFGDRMMIANATGCSSIYGGNLPTTPYCADENGRGPSWANSLFEDNAEFGFGMRLSADNKRRTAQDLVGKLSQEIGTGLARDLLAAPQVTEADIAAQRERVEALRTVLENMATTPEVAQLRTLADYLVEKSVWIIGGDGWAYDIGFGGLDHVIASGRNVNILVLDTQVYSNTGGQQSKATPTGAMAKFAAAGKQMPKKDLGTIAMSYGNVYVAQISLGAKNPQTVAALQEAASFDGPSLVIAYASCIAHGLDMSGSLDHQRDAVKSGFWPLYRFDPRKAEIGAQPLTLDSGEPSMPIGEFMHTESRFEALHRTDPARADDLEVAAQHQVDERYKHLKEARDNHAAQAAPAGGTGGAPSPVPSGETSATAPDQPKE